MVHARLAGDELDIVVARLLVELAKSDGHEAPLRAVAGGSLHLDFCCPLGHPAYLPNIVLKHKEVWMLDY